MNEMVCACTVCGRIAIAESDEELKRERCVECGNAQAEQAR